MRRPIAILITVVVFLMYGIPSFFFCFYGAQMALGSTNPSFRQGFEVGSNGMSADILLPVALGLLCVFGYLIFVPILVGVLSFFASKTNDRPQNPEVQNVTQ